MRGRMSAQPRNATTQGRGVAHRLITLHRLVVAAHWPPHASLRPPVGALHSEAACRALRVIVANLAHRNSEADTNPPRRAPEPSGSCKAARSSRRRRRSRFAAASRTAGPRATGLQFARLSRARAARWARRRSSAARASAWQARSKVPRSADTRRNAQPARAAMVAHLRPNRLARRLTKPLASHV